MRIDCSVNNLQFQNQRIETIFQSVLERDNVAKNESVKEKVKEIQDSINAGARQTQEYLAELSRLIQQPEQTSLQIDTKRVLSQEFSELNTAKTASMSEDGSKI